MFRITASLVLVSAAGAWAAEAPAVSSRQTVVRAVAANGVYTGFDVLARAGAGAGGAAEPVAEVRWSSGGRWVCRGCEATPTELRFSGFSAPGTGGNPEFGADSEVRIRLEPDEPFPLVSFRFAVTRFDAAAWRQAWQNPCPLYFLRGALPGAADQRQLFYQGGELYPGPEVDPFPITMGPMKGDWSPRWSYAPALGAAPIPAVGLWSPASRLFVGWEFQDACSTDRSERLLASSYCAGLPDHPGQFVALSYPHAGQWLNLRLPEGPFTVGSRFRVLYQRDVPSDSDPNRFVIRELLRRYADRLPPAPSRNDMHWLKQGVEASQLLFLHDLGLLQDHPKQNVAPILWRPYETCEKTFFDPGAVQLLAHQTGKAARYAWTVGDTAGLAELKRQIDYLVKHAKQERFGDDLCYVWEHPVEGQFKQSFGGPPATGTRHMFNWGIASAMLWSYRQEKTAEYLPYIDGMVKWTRHCLYDRAGMADLPWAVFSMGAANGGEFLLDYHETFRDDPERRALAAEAWRLAEVIVYRNIYYYTDDPDETDVLDPTFLLQAVNSHYWLGQVTWGEMGRIPEMAILMYLETGDPFLRYLVRGCLERFWLGTVGPTGNYTENMSIFGETGKKGSTSGGWGGNNFRWLAEPLAGAVLQVDVGPRGALAFCRGTRAVDVRDYAFAPPASYGFTLTVDADLPGAPAAAFDVQVTSPRRSLLGAAVSVNGQPLPRERFTIGSAGTDALVRGLRGGDRVTIGRAGAELKPVVLPEFRTRPAWAPLAADGFTTVDLRPQATARVDDTWRGEWGGLVPGPMWAACVPFALIDASANGGRAAVPLAGAGARLSDLAGPVVLLLGGPHVVPPGQAVASAVVRYADGTAEELKLAADEGVAVRQGMEWYDRDWWLTAFPLGRPGTRIRELTLTGDALLFALTTVGGERGAAGVAALRGQVEQARQSVLAHRQRLAYQGWQIPTRAADTELAWWDNRWPLRYRVRLVPGPGPVRRDALVRLRTAFDVLLAQVGVNGAVEPATIRVLRGGGPGGAATELPAQFCPTPEHPQRGELLVLIPGEWREPLDLAVYVGTRGSAAPAAPPAPQLTFAVADGLARVTSGGARLGFRLAAGAPGPRLVELAFGNGPNLLAKAGWDEGFGHLCACQDGVTWYDFGALQTTDAVAEVLDRGPLAMTVRVRGLEVFGFGSERPLAAVGTAGRVAAAVKGTAEWTFRVFADRPWVDSWVRYTIRDPDTRWTRAPEVRFGTANRNQGRTSEAERDGAAFAVLGDLCLVGLDDAGEQAARPYFSGVDGQVLGVQFEKPLFPGVYVSDKWRMLPAGQADAAYAAQAACPGIETWALEVRTGDRVERPAPRPVGLDLGQAEQDWAAFLPVAGTRIFTAGQPDAVAGLENRDNADEGASRREQVAGRWALLPGRTPAGGDQHFVYFRLTATPTVPPAGTPAWILVEYYDRGRGVTRLEYDSADATVRKSAVPGAFKEAAGEIRMTDSRTWRTQVFPVDDAVFAKRCNGGDLRLLVEHGSLIVSRLAVALPGLTGAAPAAEPGGRKE